MKNWNLGIIEILETFWNCVMVKVWECLLFNLKLLGTQQRKYWTSENVVFLKSDNICDERRSNLMKTNWLEWVGILTGHSDGQTFVSDIPRYVPHPWVSLWQLPKFCLFCRIWRPATCCSSGWHYPMETQHGDRLPWWQLPWRVAWQCWMGYIELMLAPSQSYTGNTPKLANN